MTRAEQREFVHTICTRVGNKVLKKIIDESIPEHWEGAELRQYVADCMSIACDPGRYLSGKRRKEYDNDITTSGIL